MALALHPADLTEAFPRAHIVCIGDVMLDRFVYGTVARISAEAPIPVLHKGHEETMLGGAGNVAANVTALDGKATLIAVIGDDDAGRRIQQLAAAQDRLTARLITVAGRQTTQKTRYIADGQQLLRADDESTHAVDEKTAAELTAALREAVGDADIVVISDYAKGVLSDTVLGAAIATAREAGKPVIADPKRADLAAYAGVTVLKPNAGELTRATGITGDSDEAVGQAAAAVLASVDIGALLVSRSERGISLIPRSGAPAHFTAAAREVFDVSGAGDTVIAAAAVALAAGAELGEAAHIANVAAGIVVGKVGTAVVGREALAAALRGHEISASEAKIIGADDALAQVRAWRTQGLKVGFTNGCFDLLHPGHVSLLRQSRAACDRLIVGLNNDASTRRLKGPERPVQGEMARAVVLASMGAVDRVVIFSEDTPLDLITRLRPDVLVKGADYTVAQVVGAAEVQGWGGRVVLADLADGHSTTQTIARLAGGNGRGRGGGA